ncbi:MAG: putative Na+/H+ antiporter [Nevskia sp.]|nr:putative Na+/H+ antiporter [Nevskia sp.]
MTPTLFQLLAAAMFALALLHTFSVAFVARIAHRFPRHAGLIHSLAEVEIVFALWAAALISAYMAMEGAAAAIAYVDGRNFTEPLFVFAIMVVAASRPVLAAMGNVTRVVARMLPLPGAAATYFAALTVIPLLGSLITEPGAMTLAALLLRESHFRHRLPVRMCYATIGVLFVNVSVGGALTPFAAPPVLMVASLWGWDLNFMLSNFAVKVIPVVLINAAAVTALFMSTLRKLPTEDASGDDHRVPVSQALLHLGFLAAIVVFAHHPPMFLGVLLLFLLWAHAYPAHQNRLIVKEALLVACFLAGLVIIGGLQQWWLKPVLQALNPQQVFVAATLLTAITDNAAVTYLAAQVPNLSDEFKYFVVAGAITGGGLTVIANAPNPAGMAILKPLFPHQTVGAGGLFIAALPPTLLMFFAFLLF